MSNEIPVFRFFDSFGSTPIVSSTLFRYRSYRSFVQHNGASKTRRYTFYGPKEIIDFIEKTIFQRRESLMDHSYDDNKCCTSFYPEGISICIISSDVVCWRNPICQCHLNKHSSHYKNEMECGIAVSCLIFDYSSLF